MERHQLTVSQVEASCGTIGHRDIHIDCSCGFQTHLHHGTREDIKQAVLYHRISAIEALVGIKFKVQYDETNRPEVIP